MIIQKNNRVIGGFYFVKLDESEDWAVLKWEDIWENGGGWSYPGSEEVGQRDEFECIEERIKMPDEFKGEIK